jgi:hypothetical protein
MLRMFTLGINCENCAPISCPKQYLEMIKNKIYTTID